jgi:uncharacterized membrane protein HdeD (DUF308 family)
MMRMILRSEEMLNVPWWLVLLEGIAVTIIGILLLISPGATTLVLVQILGFYWVIVGILSLVSLFMDRTLWGWKLFAGILGILAGLVIIRNPLWSAFFIPTLLVVLFAIEALIQGAIKLYHGFQGGGLGTFILGIVNLLIGLFLLSSPLMAAFLLPLLVGAVAIIGGIFTIAWAFRLHNSAPPAAMPQTPPTGA